MTPHRRSLLACAITIYALAGCSAAHLAGRPHRSLDRERVIRNLEQGGTTLESLIDRYYGELCRTGSDVVDHCRADIRNELIERSIVLIDQHHSIFIESFSSTKKALDVGVEIASMSTAAAATIVNAELAKSILAAISGGLTSAKSSVDKNLLYDQTVLVLVKQMEAQRRTAVVALIEGSKLPLNNYPLSAALADIERYYFAGTFDGALAGIQQNSSLEQKAADEKLERLRNTVDEALVEMRPRSAVVRKGVADETQRRGAILALEQVVRGMNAAERAAFLRITAGQFDLQTHRQPHSRVLERIRDDRDFWDTTANAFAYLRQHADAVALANVISAVEHASGMKIGIER